MISCTRIGLVLLFVAQLSLGGFAQSGNIVTAAGNGTQGFSGDGGPAITAQLFFPIRMAADSAGNLFIADFRNNCVRKISPDGIISTVAGIGAQGFSGDGGPATSARFYYPTGVAVDKSGNLYIADGNNYRIRKVTPDGIIRTVAGNGNGMYGGDDGPASSAQVNPSGIAVDAAGNLFIADIGSNRIRKVTPDGIIRTVVGTGIQGTGGDGGSALYAQLCYPESVAVDTVGNLYIADGSHRIRKVTPNGIINTVAGNGTRGFSGDGGPASAAQLNNPYDVAVDTAGTLFIADRDNNRVRIVTFDGVIKTIAGNGIMGYSGDGGPATEARLAGPSGLLVDMAGNLYIADFFSNRVRKVTMGSYLTTLFPHVAVGGGWSTSFALSNTGATTIFGNLILIDNQGNALTVNSSSLGIGSSFQISIPPGGTVFLTIDSLSPNDPQKSGWAKVVTSGGSLNGVATFFQTGSQGAIRNAASVLSSQLIQFATIPVDENASQSRFTAYGIANPTNQIVIVKLALVDSNGILVDDTVSVTLYPGQQIARYFNQDFASRQVFQGSVVMRAQGTGTFIAVALGQNQQVFTVIPVIPSKAANIPK
jgi:hypothetical protein